MSTPSEPNAQEEERTRTALAAAHEDVKFSDEAAAAILARANEVAAERRRHTPAPGSRARRRRWQMPLAVAASFVLGMLATWVVVIEQRPASAGLSADGAVLTLPAARVTRDGSAATAPVPVEKANPQDWYRYIQELIFAGQLQEAQRHLERFNELHPGFVPEPEQ